MPWFPIATVGTAVAFYVGFKNNQAYDRIWEARKIWGAIVNSSRAWATSVRGFVGSPDDNLDDHSSATYKTHQKMIVRHIGWLYTLRKQLLAPTEWEHIKQGPLVRYTTKKRIKRHGLELGSVNNPIVDYSSFFEDSEFEKLQGFSNQATQILDRQAQDLRALRGEGHLDDFQLMQLQNLINEFYDHQGKCERIKKFPLPRQYGAMSMVFIRIFIFLMPFGMAAQFHSMGPWAYWLMIPFGVIVAWVYLMMELVSDYSENPFEGLGNDIPMYALCRTIEIDLREMLGEDDIPAPFPSNRGILN